MGNSRSPMRARHVAVSMALLLMATAEAYAAEPSALVEDVVGSPAGVQAMDYVGAGTVIKLGSGDKLVLDYLHSCVHETISGGTVTVGAQESKVSGGRVERDKVACDGGKLKLSTEQASSAGTIVFRKAPGTTPAPQRRLYGASPLIEVGAPGHLTLERLDRPGERVEIEISAAQLRRGAFYDFAKDGRALAPGATYRASFGAKSVVFTIDARAQSGSTPLAGRLLRF